MGKQPIVVKVRMGYQDPAQGWIIPVETTDAGQ
jgi:hypothetical protein